MLTDQQDAVHGKAVGAATERLPDAAADAQPVLPRHEVAQIRQPEPLIQTGQRALKARHLVHVQRDYLDGRRNDTLVGREAAQELAHDHVRCARRGQGDRGAGGC